MRTVENADCGKCGVWKMRRKFQFSVSLSQSNADKRCVNNKKPSRKPIISCSDGPTERLSSFVDKLLQPIAQIQESYLKDTTHFIRFIENTRVPRNAFLVSMDVTSL